MFRWLSLLTCSALLGWAAVARAEVRVVTSTTDLADLTRAIGGPRVHVESICRGNQDPHYAQARPSYMVTLSRADLLVSVGLELEVGWLPSLIQGARNPEIQPGTPGFLDASAAISALDVPKGPVDRSRGDIHPLGNPHYWLDPLNAKRIAALIADRLTTLDKPGATVFRQRLEAFDTRIDRAMQRWTAVLTPYRGTKLVSYHRTFDYFFSRFGLVPIGYIEDRPGIPPAPAHVASLIRDMQAQHVRVIFHESYYDKSVSDLVAARTSAKLLVLPTSVAGTAAASSYELLIDELVKAFVAAVGKATPR
jgi:zinc/manganese transport system substrate-binding protein